VHPVSRYARVKTDDSGRVIDWREKARLGGFINGGFLVLDRKVFDYIEGNCEFEEEPMRHLAAEGQVRMYRHDGFWHCMDTYRDYLVLKELWRKKETPWKVWKH